MADAQPNPPTAVNTGLLTPPFRVSFPYLFNPRPAQDATKKPMYELAMLFQPGTDLSALKAAAKAAAMARWPDATTRPKGLKSPFRDGAEKALDGYGPGIVFVGARSSNKPLILDQRRQPIIDTSKVYPGCWGVARVHFYAFDKSGNKGVACGLDGFQLMKDDTPFVASCDVDDFTDLPVATATGGGGAAAPKSAAPVDDLELM